MIEQQIPLFSQVGDGDTPLVLPQQGQEELAGIHHSTDLLVDGFVERVQVQGGGHHPTDLVQRLQPIGLALRALTLYVLQTIPPAVPCNCVESTPLAPDQQWVYESRP